MTNLSKKKPLFCVQKPFYPAEMTRQIERCSVSIGPETKGKGGAKRAELAVARPERGIRNARRFGPACRSGRCQVALDAISSQPAEIPRSRTDVTAEPFDEEMTA